MIFSFNLCRYQQTRSGPYEGVPAHAVVFQVVAKHLRPLHLRGAGLPQDDGADDGGKVMEGDHDPFEVLFSDLYQQCWAPAVGDRPTSLEVVHVIGMWLEHVDK